MYRTFGTVALVVAQVLAGGSARAHVLAGAETLARAIDGRDEYRVRFIGGRPATIVIEGTGPDRVEVTVCDEQGHFVEGDLASGEGRTSITWTPAVTGTYTIVVFPGLNPYQMECNGHVTSRV
jgi:hypothetical protein